MTRTLTFVFVSLVISLAKANDPLCAGLPEDEETYFPSPVACNHYYKCLNGVFTEEICPQGRYFSANNNGCVDPQYAECVGGSGSPSQPTQADTTTVEPTRITISTTPEIVDTIVPSTTTTEYPTTPTTSTTTLSPDTTTLGPVITTPSNTDPRCDGGVTSYWPHPSECNLYIECYHGNSYEMACPSNKYFSDSQKKCVEVEESECCAESPSKC